MNRGKKCISKTNIISYLSVSAARGYISFEISHSLVDNLLGGESLVSSRSPMCTSGTNRGQWFLQALQVLLAAWLSLYYHPDWIADSVFQAFHDRCVSDTTYKQYASEVTIEEIEGWSNYVFLDFP